MSTLKKVMEMNNSTLVPTDESKDTGKIWTTMEKNKGSY